MSMVMAWGYLTAGFIIGVLTITCFLPGKRPVEKDRLTISTARVCCQCDSLIVEYECPSCAGENTISLSRWLNRKEENHEKSNK